MERANHHFYLCYKKLKYFFPLPSSEAKGCSFFLEIGKVANMIRKAAQHWNHVPVARVCKVQSLRLQLCSLPSVLPSGLELTANMLREFKAWNEIWVNDKMPDEFGKGASIHFVLPWSLITNKKVLLTTRDSSSVSVKSHTPPSSLSPKPWKRILWNKLNLQMAN